MRPHVPWLEVLTLLSIIAFSLFGLLWTLRVLR